MYIVQMADLHIGSETDSSEETIINGAIKTIKQNIPKGQKLLICVCGDIIDSKNSATWGNTTAQERYANAATLLRSVSVQLKSEYDLIFKFCLGNHDVTHRNEFTAFAKEFDPKITEDELRTGYYKEWDGINYIFLNSCKDNKHECGGLDYQWLERTLQDIGTDKPKIIVMHHTFISMYEQDDSSVRDTASLLQLVEKYKVFGVLHGHIHGRESFVIGQNKCRIIGTGALFSRNFSNVNSQFNIINVEPFHFEEISKYIYQADDKITGNPWRKISSERDENENYFTGSSFQEVYNRLLNELSRRSVINNAVLQIKSSYEEFKNNLEEFLQDDKLSIGEQNFSYFDIAEKWEKIKVPENLYFNHGQYFKIKDSKSKVIHGIKLVANQLKNKPTTHKAVLTTYDVGMIDKMLKGEEYLPSLLSIQFGRSGDGRTMYVHIYLRALEATRFLKINICEILWLLNCLKEDNVLFEDVDITISAFRVQKIEGFNCFFKAEIDKIDCMDLYSYVYEGDISKICQMLSEKKNFSETITEVGGLKQLSQAMTKSSDKPQGYKYNKAVIDELEELLKTYKKLDAIHKKGSVKTQEEKEYETKICNSIDKIIGELEKNEDN